MATPNPLASVKGAGTTLLIYTGKGSATKTPLDDTGWTKLAQIRELQPGEISAESYDDTWLDDEDADWKATAQGEKSAGEASITLAWKPGEPHQHFLISPEDFLSASAAGTIVALVHSHPDGPAELSAADKSARVHSACSWWLVCGDKIYCFGDEDELN